MNNPYIDCKKAWSGWTFGHDNEIITDSCLEHCDQAKEYEKAFLRWGVGKWIGDEED